MKNIILKLESNREHIMFLLSCGLFFLGMVIPFYSFSQENILQIPSNTFLDKGYQQQLLGIQQEEEEAEVQKEMDKAYNSCEVNADNSTKEDLLSIITALSYIEGVSKSDYTNIMRSCEAKSPKRQRLVIKGIKQKYPEVEALIN